MNPAEYQKIWEKAKPIIAKKRRGEKTTPEENALVAKAFAAREELYAVKPPLCYVPGIDVRKFIPVEKASFSYDESYRKKLKAAVKKLVKKIILGDLAAAEAKNKKTLSWGDARQAEREKRKAERQRMKEQKEAERKAIKAKREAEKKKLLEKKKARIMQLAQKYGLSVS